MAQTGQPGGRYPSTLDNNSINRPAAPPSAESAGDQSLDANASVNRNGYVSAGPAAATRHLAPPENITDEPYSSPTDTGLTYPNGQPNTNRIKGYANELRGI